MFQAGDLKLEVGGWMLLDGDRRSRCWWMEAYSWMLVVGSRSMEVGCWRLEGESWRMVVSGWRVMVRRWRLEAGGCAPTACSLPCHFDTFMDHPHPPLFAVHAQFNVLSQHPSFRPCTPPLPLHLLRCQRGNSRCHGSKCKA